MEDAGPVAERKPRKALAIAALVCGILGLCLLALIVIPSLTPIRHGGFDTAGACNLRGYATSQAMFIKTDWYGTGKQYANPLTELHTLGSGPSAGKAIALIDSGLAGAVGPAGTPKQGFLFRECRTIGGKPVDWKKDFALCAKPAFYDRTGIMTSIVSTHGTVWWKDLGPSGGFVDDFPANPRAAGWTKAD